MEMAVIKKLLPAATMSRAIRPSGNPQKAGPPLERQSLQTSQELRIYQRSLSTGVHDSPQRQHFRTSPAKAVRSAAGMLQQLLQYRVRGLSFRMRIKIQNQAVAQHGPRNAYDVLRAQMHPSSHESQHTAAFNQCLRTTRRAAIPNIALGYLRRMIRARLRRHDQLDRILLDMRRHDHLPRKHLDRGNFAAIHDLCKLDLIRIRVQLHDPA